MSARPRFDASRESLGSRFAPATPIAIEDSKEIPRRYVHRADVLELPPPPGRIADGDEDGQHPRGERGSPGFASSVAPPLIRQNARTHACIRYSRAAPRLASRGFARAREEPVKHLQPRGGGRLAGGRRPIARPNFRALNCDRVQLSRQRTLAKTCVHSRFACARALALHGPLIEGQQGSFVRAGAHQPQSAGVQQGPGRGSTDADGAPTGRADRARGPHAMEDAVCSCQLPP